MRLLKSLLSDIFRNEQVFGYLYWNYKGVRVSMNTFVSPRAKVASTCGFYANSFVTFRASVGHYTYGTHCMIDNAIVGRFCSIAPGALIGALGHPIDNVSTHPMTYMNTAYDDAAKPAAIGDDVWIGANTVILSGVTIPSGCVIAAGAVVTKDIEPFTIVGGIPAKVIGVRHVSTGFVDEIALTNDPQQLKRIADKARQGFWKSPAQAVQ
jgi:acetyltransferase-like isoleucine patch superfamily enzyme